MSGHNEQKSLRESLRGWLTDINTLLALVVAIAGLVAQLFQSAPALPWIGLALLAVALIWLGSSAYRRWINRPVQRLDEDEQPHAMQIRGPRPFEDGDELLGRKREIAEIFSTVHALDFRFGYLSGEAGAGKTSLLRAGLSKRFKEKAPTWTLLYVPRTGARPDREIAKRLQAMRGAASTPEADLAEEAEIALKNLGDPLLIACDQFEEFFLSCRTEEARAPVIVALRHLWELSREQGKLRLLFCLRKEFVDDLLSLAEDLPELRLQDQRFSLSNLPLDVTIEMIEKIVELGELPLSPQLRSRVAADLARDGRVRPVELQIVLTRMLEQQIYDVRAYEERGGAQGIMSRFIAETIEPPDRDVPEIDRQVARHLLRGLCAENFAARRPIGLTIDALTARVIEQLGAAEGGTTFGAEDVRRAVARVARDLRKAWILIEEDEEHINLAHDYLAPAIRDATADIETAEERANRILEQYVGHARIERSIVIPIRALRHIKKYSSNERRTQTEARKLIRRSERRYAVVIGLIVILSLVAPAAALPFGWRDRQSSRISLDGALTISTDRRLLAALKDNRLTLYRLDAAPLGPISVDLPVIDLAMSPTGDRLLLLARDGGIYLAEARNGFRPTILIARSGWTQPRFNWSWGAFSPDGGWAAFATATGQVYVAPVAQRPRLLANLAFLPDQFARSIPVAQATATVPGSRDANRLLPPKLLFSPRGAYLALLDGEKMRVFSLRSFQEVWSADIQNEFQQGVVWAFSPNEERLAWVAPQNEVLVRRVASPDGSVSRPFFVSQPENPNEGPAYLTFSPDSRWLVLRLTFGSFYSWHVDTPGSPFPAIDRGHSDSDTRSLLRFDSSSRQALGRANDRNIYLWLLARPPGRAARPLLIERGSSFERLQSAEFCADSPTGLVTAEDGTIYRFTAGASQTLQPVQRMMASSASIVRAVSGDTVFVYNTNEVGHGECERGALDTVRVDSDIQTIALGADPRDLLVIDNKGVTLFRRSFFVLGFPVLDREWPALSPIEP